MVNRRVNQWVNELFRPVYRHAHHRIVPFTDNALDHHGCAGYWFNQTVAAKLGISIGAPLQRFPVESELDSAFRQVFTAIGVRHDPTLAKAVIQTNDGGSPYRAMRLIKQHIERNIIGVAV